VATNKELFQKKVDRAHAARIKAEEFVAAGGDLQADEGGPLCVEMIEAWNDLSKEFEHAILKDSKDKPR
jgi:hypothetical protein